MSARSARRARRRSPPPRRRRCPRRRPAPASARRSGSGSRSRSWPCEDVAAPGRPRNACAARPGTARGRTSTGATTSSPPSNEAPGANRRPRRRRTCRASSSRPARTPRGRGPPPRAPARSGTGDRQRADDGPPNARSPGRLPSARRPYRVDTANELGVEADAGVEREQAPVERPSEMRRCRPFAIALGGAARVPRKPERAGQHTRATARDEADRDICAEAVDHLVVGAVAREDVDRRGPAATTRRRARSPPRAPCVSTVSVPAGRAAWTAASLRSLTPLANGLTIRTSHAPFSRGAETRAPSRSPARAR